MGNKLALLVAALIVSVVSIGSSPVAASAGSGSCSGSLIARDTAVIDGSVVAELVVYYEPATGNNCARLNKLGPAYGVAGEMFVQISKCAETRPSGVCTFIAHSAPDSGTFAYYAGPVRIHSPNNCVNAHAQLRFRGQQRLLGTAVNVGC